MRSTSRRRRVRSRLRRGVIAAVALALTVATAAPARAQPPARAEATLAIAGALIHTLTGPPIEGGTVLVRGGAIAAVGREVTVPRGAMVIDGTDLVVVPGFFDALSTLGLAEIASLAATQDAVELGAFNPHLRALVAVHPASEHIAVARANGVTHAGVAPAGAGYGIAGQASAIHLDGWTIEDMAIAPSVGLMVTWPELVTRGGERGARPDRSFTDAKKEYDQRVGEIRQWVAAARRHATALEAPPAGRPRTDQRLASLSEVIAGRLPFFVRVNEPRQIDDALALAEEESLRLVIVGGRAAWPVAHRLAEKNVPVILGPSQALPLREDDPYDRPYTLAGDLHRAGVTVAISTFGASASFSLPYEAAQAVAFGLPWAAGLEAITLNPARILGLDDRLGTIEPGKVANLVIADGDPLEIRTSVLHVLVRGVPVDLANKHTRLYERYRARPSPAR